MSDWLYKCDCRGGGAVDPDSAQQGGCFQLGLDTQEGTALKCGHWLEWFLVAIWSQEQLEIVQFGPGKSLKMSWDI